jgi:hypothetical protein
MTRLLFLGTFAIASALFVPTSLMASQEGVLPIGDLHVTSPGIGESGPVEVTATRGPNGFSSLAIQAFGRTTMLTEVQLAALQGQFVNGVQLSYEAGYKELGGRTVYIVPSKGFTSGIQETHRISINEQGSVAIEPPTRASSR